LPRRDKPDGSMTFADGCHCNALGRCRSDSCVTSSERRTKISNDLPLNCSAVINPSFTGHQNSHPKPPLFRRESAGRCLLEASGVEPWIDELVEMTQVLAAILVQWRAKLGEKGSNLHLLLQRQAAYH
jgi:hypothetical protein